MKNIQVGPQEKRFNGVVGQLWMMAQVIRAARRFPSVTEKNKAKALLGELVYLEGKVLAEVAASSRQGRGYRPDLKENPFKREYVKYLNFFKD